MNWADEDRMGPPTGVGGIRIGPGLGRGGDRMGRQRGRGWVVRACIGAPVRSPAARRRVPPSPPG